MGICIEMIISNTIHVFHINKKKKEEESCISEVECIFKKFNFSCMIYRGFFEV